MYRLLLLCFLFSTQVVLAQSDSSSRMVYLHTDKSAYVAGDTIWFKAYVRSGPLPDMRTRNLLLEFFAPQGRLLARVRRPLIAGMGLGELVLPADGEAGVYLVRSLLPADELRPAELGYQVIPVLNPEKDGSPNWGAVLPGRPATGNNAIRVMNSDKGKVFYADGSRFPKAAWVQGVQDGVVIFRQALRKDRTEPQAGRVPLDKLNSGRIEFQLTDEGGAVLEETSSLVLKTDEQIQVSLKADTLEKRAGGRIALSFAFADSLEGSFSLSVTDADRELTLPLRPNILSGLLTGHAHALDAAQLNGASVPEGTLLPRPKTGQAGNLKDEAYINITGTVTAKKKKKQWNEISFMVVQKDSTQELLSAPIDADGRFRLENLIADDTVTVFYQASNTGNAELLVDSAQVWKGPEGLPEGLYAGFDLSAFTKEQAVARAKRNYEDLRASVAAGQRMEEIFIRTRRTKPSETLSKRYTTGAFSNMSMVKVYDFINDPICPPIGNIFDCMQSRISGIRIVRRSGLDYDIRSNRAVSITGGVLPVVLFLDEVQQNDTRLIASIPMANIALVKYFQPGYFPLATGIAPVIAIYTKKPEDMGAGWKTNLRSFKWIGYTPTALFTPGESAGAAALRTTLVWQPELSVDWGKELTYSFINTSGAKRLRVVLEGITREGRLVHLEQVIE